VSARPIPEHINAFTKDGQVNEPVASRPPHQKKDREKGCSRDKHIGTDIGAREEVDESGESKRQRTQNQEKAEVDFPASGDSLRFVEIKVIG
jgi:hypothetical protein